MTSPIYTATAGPADKNAPLAAKFYTTVTGLFGLVAIALAFGIITPDQASALDNLKDAGLAFAVAVPSAVAAFRTRKQLNNGTFDKAPELPSVPALEQLAILRDQAAAEVDRAVANTHLGVGAIQAAVAALPGGGAAGGLIASGADSLGDLLRSVTALNNKS